MNTKGERRERVRKNQSKMIVRGRGIFAALRMKVIGSQKSRPH